MSQIIDGHEQALQDWNFSSACSRFSAQCLVGTSGVRVVGVRTEGGGVLRAPSSKSMSIRAMILASLAVGPSTLRNLLKSEDTYWCWRALQALGVQGRFQDPHTLVIAGRGGVLRAGGRELYLGGSGIASRFLLAVLACRGWQGDVAVITVDGNRSLRRRRFAALQTALESLGARFVRAGATPGHLPLQCLSHVADGGAVTLEDTLSSQYLSALLMATALCARGARIAQWWPVCQQGYVDLTVSMLMDFGVQIRQEEGVGPERGYRVYHVPAQEYRGCDITMEGDVSSMCYLLALSALHSTEVVLEHWQRESWQADREFCEVLKAMGCEFEEAGRLRCLPPMTLRGGMQVNMYGFSDQALTLGCLALFADAPITITQVEHIRFHECDRLQALADNIWRLGGHCECTTSSITVYPLTAQQCEQMADSGPVELPSYGDHRVVMAFALVASKFSHIILQDPGVVCKTFPFFFDVLHDFGCELKWS